MLGAQSSLRAQTYLIRVGREEYPIYGDEAGGWSLDERDLSSQTAVRFRYRTIDELIFALVNLYLSPEGHA